MSPTRGRVAEFLHKGVILQEPAYPVALEADPLPVDQAYLPESPVRGQLQVLLHRLKDFPRPECVQIQMIFQRELDRVRIVRPLRAFSLFRFVSHGTSPPAGLP